MGTQADANGASSERSALSNSRRRGAADLGGGDEQLHRRPAAQAVEIDAARQDVAEQIDVERVELNRR